ncbi:MAG: TonB C-terminal domain-containing protein [Gemmatimonadaceae bacterium]
MRAPLGAALLLHAVLLAAIVVSRPGAAPAMPPMYRVDLVAAPPGARAAGVVRPQPPTAPAPTPAPPPPARENTPTKAMPLPKPLPARPAPVAATPSPAPVSPKPATPAPVAGGGPTGGRGTDVATVRTEGIDFPYPGYLANIVRQIAINFHPKPGSAARAEVMFLVKRDGTVTSFRFLTRSGDFAFDLEAQGAVEAAANARSFGKLPEGFADDVLPVIFTFDPRVLR